MKNYLFKKNGVSLISIIIISVIVIAIIAILLSTLQDGILVLSKAQTASKETKESEFKEHINLILASFETKKATDTKLKFNDFLKQEAKSENVSNYWYSNKVVIIKYNSEYAILLNKDNKSVDDFEYRCRVKLENDDSAKKCVENYNKSINMRSSEKIAFEDKNVYLISKSVRQDCYDFKIGDNKQVGIVFLDNIEINNKGKKQAAIDIGENSSVDIYVYNDIIISSLYNGTDKIQYNRITSDKGYAGISLPSSSNLKFSGQGTVKVYGGPAGKGGTYDSKKMASGAGGGGAGAGIGGNGGQGGEAKENQSEDGKDGESCGTVQITDRVELIAYGGSGADGGNSTLEGAGAGGGYPAAGIGGGRSWWRWSYQIIRSRRLFWRCWYFCGW